MVGLDCFLDVVRALGMGSCLSVEGPATYGAVPLTAAPVSKSRKRRVAGSSSPTSTPASSNLELWLHRIPGRMFLNGSSDFASLFSKQGKKGVNQDAMIAWENFGSADTTFCGVFDGHGPFGHMVARKVRDALPLKLTSQLVLNNSVSTAPADEAGVYRDQKDKEHHDLLMTLKDSFLKAFKVMDKELKFHPSIDCYCSGTTAVAMVKQGQNLVIANIGDSRAVLGTRDKDGSIVAAQLTVDLKPNLPREAERIMLCKGRVFALQNEPEVSRVWLPHSNSPGLAMARAFGDFCLKDFGLISVPDITYRRLTDQDEFVVLATDGVNRKEISPSKNDYLSTADKIWDVLTNKEVVDIVSLTPRPSAARALVESANRAWRVKYPYAKVDDCAVVCLFFNPNRSDTPSHFSPTGGEEMNSGKSLNFRVGVST